MLVAEDRTLDLMAVDELLDEDLAVHPERLGQALGQLEHVVRLGNADRRALRARLDEYRERAELLGRRADNALGIARKVARQREIVARLTHARALDDLFGQRLVHRVRARRNAATDIRDACQLEHALHGAVLAAYAMQHGEHAVEADELGLALAQQHEAMDAAVGRQQRRNEVVPVFPCAGLDRVRVALRQIVPPALARDADRMDFIFRFIKIAQNGCGRQARNVVLTRNAAKDHSQFHFSVTPSQCFVLILIRIPLYAIPRSITM